MKKIISILLLSFVTLFSNAQYWQQCHTDADELRNTKATSYKAIKTTDNFIITIDDNTNKISIFSDDSVFDYELFRDYFHIVDVLFGMYDTDNKLVGKETLRMFVPEDMPTMAMTFWGPEIAFMRDGYVSARDKIVSWVRNNKGSLRLVVPIYGDVSLDVSVPTEPSQIVPNEKKTTKPTARKAPSKGKTSKK